MSTTRRSIFRDEAIRQYMQGRDKDILPRYVSPPMFLVVWILVGLCIAAGFIAWNTHIPVYVSGVGEIVKVGHSDQNIAVIFLSPDEHLRVRHGQSVQLQIGAARSVVEQVVASVEPTILSPSAARQHYGLDGALSLVVTQPSIVVEVTLDARLVSPLYRGSILHAEIQVGSQRVLSLLPIANSLVRE